MKKPNYSVWDIINDLERMRVPGGWIVKLKQQVNIPAIPIVDAVGNRHRDQEDFHGWTEVDQILFVPDPKHEWPLLDNQQELSNILKQQD